MWLLSSLALGNIPSTNSVFIGPDASDVLIVSDVLTSWWHVQRRYLFSACIHYLVHEFRDSVLDQINMILAIFVGIYSISVLLLLASEVLLLRYAISCISAH